jgi:hypothetical protein
MLVLLELDSAADELAADTVERVGVGAAGDERAHPTPVGEHELHRAKPTMNRRARKSVSSPSSSKWTFARAE